MSVLEEKALKDLKGTYNHYLSRYDNGCQYLSKKVEETEKWLPELLEIMERINILLEEIKKYIEVTDNEILNGFVLKENQNETNRK